jgi:hypothetical protein
LEAPAGVPARYKYGVKLFTRKRTDVIHDGHVGVIRARIIIGSIKGTIVPFLGRIKTIEPDIKIGSGAVVDSGLYLLLAVRSVASRTATDFGEARSILRPKIC